eukprot:4208849-Prymnesium_polylepis.1
MDAEGNMMSRQEKIALGDAEGLLSPVWGSFAMRLPTQELEEWQALREKTVPGCRVHQGLRTECGRQGRWQVMIGD